MNDFAAGAPYYLAVAADPTPALETCLKLADTPSKPIGYESPARFNIALFEAGGIN